MARLCGVTSRTGGSILANENLANQQQPLTDMGNQRRSALGDISAIVSNVSSSTSSIAKGLGFTSSARSTNPTTGTLASCAAKAGLFTGSSTNSLPTNHSDNMEKREQQTAAAMPPKGGSVQMDPVDSADSEDPQFVAEYVGEIFQHFRKKEARYMPQPDYMEKQQDLNEKMRGILVDWLVEVHLKYKLKPETLYLAINLIDRFLEKRQVNRKKLQLVGVCGMLIASKYEEIYPPEIRDFVYITDKAYTKDEILAMEITMLNALEFKITLPSAVAFLERFAKVSQCSEVQLCLARYALELTLCDMKMMKYCPSHLAASAVFLSNKLLRRHPAWSGELVKHTTYTEQSIKACAKELCCLVEQADRPGTLSAVRKKYAQQRFHAVSTIVASTNAGA